MNEKTFIYLFIISIAPNDLWLHIKLYIIYCKINFCRTILV